MTATAPRKLPILATLLVAVAVAAMIMLGVWQLTRAHWKEDLLRRYQAAEGKPPIAFPTGPISHANASITSRAMCWPMLKPSWSGWRRCAVNSGA